MTLILWREAVSRVAGELAGLKSKQNLVVMKEAIAKPRTWTEGLNKIVIEMPRSTHRDGQGPYQVLITIM